MIKEDNGQVALEYLLIFAVSLILLIVFTLPLAEYTIKDTLDVSDTLKVKSDLSKVAQAIKQVYGQGQGSRQTVTVVSSKAVKFNVAENQVSCDLKLKGGSNKLVKVGCNSNLKKTGISINKGETIIVVEWPVNDENMIIYTKLF